MPLFAPAGHHRSRAANVCAMLVALSCLWLLSGGLRAESPAQLQAAGQLLRAAQVGDLFETRARQQAQQIIHNYSVIIQRNTDYRLPVVLERRIEACYRDTYQWKFFEPGITRIVADAFSREELELLIDFHNNLGLPPNKIALFRNTIGKADWVHEQSVDFIFNNSNGCVDQDAELIIRHLLSNDVL